MSSREIDVNLALWSHFRKVTPELLALFFFEREIPVVYCPICASKDLSIPRATETIDGEDVTYVHPSKVETFGAEPQHSLLQYHYRLICKNCGFENRFSVHPVLHWLEDRQKEEENS